VLSVLDGAVLVISAVEGVQAQTRVLMRALQRLRIPVLIFVNKIDRGGARYGSVLRGIAKRLTPGIAAMGSAHGLGTPSAGFTPFGPGDAAFAARLADLLTGHDDALLAAWVDDETAVTYPRLVFPALALLQAVPRAPAMQDSLCLLEGDIPAARVHELQQQLPALTRGEGVLEWAFDHYRPVRGQVPARARSDHNPLSREEYLLHVVRRVAAR
jgi:translation elongation factor EF-G